MKIRTVIIITILPILFFSCKSRLQPNLYQRSETGQFLLKDVASYYIHGYNLTDESQLSYMRPGDGTVLVSKRIGPPEGQIRTLGKVFSVEEKMAYQILVELPANLRQDSLDIKGHSLCRLEGRFDLDENLRIYRCTYGFLAIDTIWTSSFRARLSGTYVNGQNDTLVFEGDIKAERRD